MKRKVFKHSYKVFKAFFGKDIIDVKMGAKIVFSLILGLLEDNEVLTKDDICKANNQKKGTTYFYIKMLEDEGYLTSQRSNEYYAKSFVELTDKGRLTASRLRRVLL